MTSPSLCPLVWRGLIPHSRRRNRPFRKPFAEIGVAIRKASPFPYTLFCGYSNGRTGDYMPIESEYKYGGYEVERTPYGLGAADKVISEIISLFAQVR